MRFAGRVFESGRYWAVEIPILDVVSQGRSKKEALEMIADAVEALVGREEFKIEIFPGRNGDFTIGASDDAALTALLLRRLRLKSGLSLAEVAARLGSNSPNSYARYEQRRSAPSVQKLSRLFAAVAPGGDFILIES
jgi:predicted RNase H-like HicB family nuclease